MGNEVCPIFDGNRVDNKLTLVGVWMEFPQNLNLVPDKVLFSNQRELGPVLAKFLQENEIRQIPNTEVNLGSGNTFYNGHFLMCGNHPAPSEPGGVPNSKFDYAMEDQNGVVVCVRYNNASQAVDESSLVKGFETSNFEFSDKMKSRIDKYQKISKVLFLCACLTASFYIMEIYFWLSSNEQHREYIHKLLGITENAMWWFYFILPIGFFVFGKNALDDTGGTRKTMLLLFSDGKLSDSDFKVPEEIQPGHIAEAEFNYLKVILEDNLNEKGITGKLIGILLFELVNEDDLGKTLESPFSRVRLSTLGSLSGSKVFTCIYECKVSGTRTCLVDEGVIQGTEKYK